MHLQQKHCHIHFFLNGNKSIYRMERFKSRNICIESAPKYHDSIKSEEKHIVTALITNK